MRALILGGGKNLELRILSHETRLGIRSVGIWLIEKLRRYINEVAKVKQNKKSFFWEELQGRADGIGI